MRSKPSEKPPPTANQKKGLWSPDEDLKLTSFIINHPHVSWKSVPLHAGLHRNGKSCRLRWTNYLRPGLKRGPFSSQEENTILTLHASLGNKWSQISQHLPGRTDNNIKNYWHSYLKKRFCKSNAPPNPICESHTNSNSFVDITNTSSVDMDQSVLPIFHVNNLPKISSVDWTSQDQEFQRDLDKITDHLSHECSQQNKVKTYSSGSNEDMFDDQIFNFDFGDLDFDIDDDFMCMLE
ncbi:hypothetical protein OSB04_026172 [Centaurea solstitialis]|uniref:Uncharacterized protein n=1 Tax=Centaurea solstitialis TaxID=347529 RepID=A0AA38SNH9_9ASTR|nr:hypothetical protein OSB04_026172 [Centaurea solstitialis]